MPLTPSADWVETTAYGALGNSGGANFPGGCGSCRTNVDNATGIEWPVPSLAVGASRRPSRSIRWLSTRSPPAASRSPAPPASVGGTVATITDPNTSATPSAYTATINWGDGYVSPGTITGSNGAFTVTGTHSYAAAGSFPVAVTITSVGTSQGSSTVNDTAPSLTAAPVITARPPSVGATGAGFTGSVNPDGLPTTASFQYGLDPKYTGGGPIVYNQSTPAQTVGSDFTSHTVTASVSGLVPNAVYHVRLVATNSAGTTFGPDVTFTTLKARTPGAPAVGKTFNLSPVNGVVLIKVNGQFVPLTELKQIPKNTVIDALHGTLKLTTALPGGGGARDAAAKGKKKKVKTQSGTFGGAIFKISQARNGLATLTLVEGAVKGGPSFARARSQGRRPTPPPPPARRSSSSTRAPRASSARRAATAPPPSAAPSGRSRTAATAP